MKAAQQRQQLILETARERGAVDVRALAGELDVAAETVRRDLHALEGRGLVRRTHGGAHPVDTPHFETQVMHRAHHWGREKQQIAAACVEQLAGQETLYLDQGSTALEVARGLRAVGGPLTVVTPSLRVASGLATRPRTEVLFLGGRVRGTSLATVGRAAIAMLDELRPDAAVLTASGISLERGATTSDGEAAELKRTAVRSSGRAIFAGDHTKFGVGSFCRFAAVQDFALVITDGGLSGSVAARYRSHGVDLVRAPS